MLRSLHLVQLILLPPLPVLLHAEVSVPSIFGDHMVFQRDLDNPVWGKASPGEIVTVQINGQTHQTETNEFGEWKVSLAPLPVGGPYTLEIQGTNTLTFNDVLSGEVWICSGQSNMKWELRRANDADLEIQSAHYPQIRHIRIPNVGSSRPLDDFDSSWQVCSPKTAGSFSAVGYLFGRRIHNTLQVPVGLINNAWSGSSAEGWLPAEVMATHSEFDQHLKEWTDKIAAYTEEVHQQKENEYQTALTKWNQKQEGPRPRAPKDLRTNPHRPGNIFNGVLTPTIGYGIKGVIWYQGESNVGRADAYQKLITLLIETWRKRWGQGDFPFYWVQLADYGEESIEMTSSSLPKLRNAQTQTLNVVNTGQAVIIDVGEGRDIHPRDKQTVANRLARLALARDYGFNQIADQSPMYQSMEIHGDKILLTFKHVSDGGLYTFDVDEALGFSIAGADKEFKVAKAKLVGKNQIEVHSEDVPEPKHVSYAWSQNPVVNVYDKAGLPLTPFRTDW